MAKGNAIAAAVLASSGNSGNSGGANVAGGLSPLVASYNSQYSVNRPYSPLPRPPAVFTEGAFGPFTPAQPMPIDPPREDTGRPDVRRFQYPVGWNLPTGQPGTEGLKLAPFAVLRSLADSYSVARSCVDKRKQEIIGLEWDIVPTDEAEHALMGDDKARSDFEERRAKVKEFFSHPDSDRAKFPTFQSWLSALLEDRFVIDAVAVHLAPTRKKGAGLFGSDLASLDIIDGSMIRPLLNTLGSTPRPAAPAYEQYAWGVPRVDLLSVITDADIEDLDEPVADYRADQLIYMRETPRNQTPYGLSCIEKALLPINIGLARQQFQSDYFTDGTVPGMFVVPGPDISTPQQIRQLQDGLNAMANDIGAKHRIIVLPPGSKADPQKPAPLADQTDEWIISQVAMPFGLTPMDLGVTPRVSAVQTPSESRELSQINSDKGSQTRVEPVCNDLKAVLFDRVIRDIFGQKDMEFSWGLKDRGKNRQAIIDQGVQLVTIGAETIDGLRVQLGEQPYGLPETSSPLMVTPTGPVPLAAVASENALVPGQPAGQPAAGGGNAPPQVTDEDLTTPMHEAHEDLADTPGGSGDDHSGATAKQAAELEILSRYLRKGRDLGKFRADHLPPEALEAAARALPLGPGAAVKAAADATEAKQRQARREKQIAAAAAILAAVLGRLVRAYKAGQISLPAAIDGAVDAMEDGYESAMGAGSSDASGDYENTPETDASGISSAASSAAEGQRGYLTGFIQDVVGGLSAAKIAARIGQYVAGLRAGYNSAYGTTAANAHPDYGIVWELGANEDHCVACIDRDGKVFTLETLPGWPGDGGFGSGGGAAAAMGQQNICEGGPNCHCSVRLVQDGQTLAIGRNTQLPGATSYYRQQLQTITAARLQAQAERDAFTASIPAGAGTRAMTRDQLRRAVADAANARIRSSGGYHGVSVEPQDIPASIIAAMLPPGMEGAAGLSMPQVNVAQAVDEMFAAKASLVTLDMTKAEFGEILKGVLEDLAHAGAALTGPAADPHEVYRQLAVNYEPRGIAWVLDLPWRGPVDVPLDMIDWDSEDEWAASEPGANSAHVARFAQRIGADPDSVNPAVLVHVPGSAKLKIVDGHHRSLADKEAGRPVRAWVGQAPSGDPSAPWFEAHLYQRHQGGDPMNKAAGDEDPTRVAFILFRAPNENGKSRYLLQKRDDQAPHGGTWGLPGGKAHEGESPWDAALREAGEELGDVPGQLKPAAVWTRPEDGHVVWTYLVDLPAMFSPSSDGETSDETAGWGWFRRKDVANLNLHPAMAETWSRLDFTKPRLGGDVPDVAKAASGYNLSPGSGMISLDVPEGLIEPVPGGVTDFHVTVCYLGKGLDDAAFSEACRRVSAAAAAVPGPLDGVISGRGLFEPSDSSDGRTVVWAGVTLPGSEQLRDMLADLSASQFAQWSKHITLAYVDDGDPLPDPVPPTPVTFTHVSVHRGDDVVRIPLGAGQQGEPRDGDRSTCPCGTPVIYDESNGWQHADGSVSHDDGESVSDKMRSN